MIERIQIQSTAWIDAQSPSVDETAQLYRDFGLDSYVADELPASIERSKVRFFDTHTYVVLQFPSIEGVTRGGKKCELDFIIGKNFLISVHYEDMVSIKVVSRDALANPQEYSDPIALFFHIVFKQYRDIGKELEGIDLLIEEAEQEIFESQDASTVEKISHINHRILDFKRAMRFHADIWNQLTEKNDSQFFVRAEAEYHKLWNALEHYREITQSLQSTNDSLLSYKTNEVMKFLTVLNFIVLPVAIIPTALGLATNNQERIYVIGFFALISLVIYAYFRRKSWF